MRKLEEENRELKETILAMKTNELYQLNADKVKDFLRENDNLRQEVKKLKSEMDNALIEKDFLKRNNDALKERYEEMIKEGGK